MRNDPMDDGRSETELAEECEARAQAAPTEAERLEWTKDARNWRRLAEFASGEPRTVNQLLAGEDREEPRVGGAFSG